MSVYLLYLYLLLGVLPALVLLWKIAKKDIQTYHIVPMTCLLFVASIFEIGVVVYGYETSCFSRLYMLLEAIAIFYFFSFYRNHRAVYLVFLLSYCVIYLVNLFHWKGEETMHMDSYLVIIETLFVITFSTLWLKSIFDSAPETVLLQNSHFYFVSGLIIYFSGTFFLLLWSDYILKNMEYEYGSFMNLNIMFNLIFRILLLLAIWKNQRK